MQTKTYPARNLMGARYDGKHSYFTVQPHGSNTLRVAACCAALLLACWSHSSNGQPASQQLALTTRSPNITLHNYTLAGQALYTVCPCKDNWQYRLQNGTLLQLYGCANPENDPAGPFCEIDPRGASCPSSETLSMNIAGRGRRLVVPCLPERKRTISGCLCSSFWSERDGVNFRMQWPILPRDELQRGLHEGWLLAGNCSAALALPGGPRCLVVEGSCTNTPAKAYPPPTPNQFWQITSADAQGWDFCSDPTYESQRAQQPNSTGELLRNLPANVQASVQMTTQAGCVCSPGNWTYYPSQIAQAGQPLQSFLGCSNPDADPKGAWCPVDPVACPSHYGAKQPEKPGDVPRDMWYNRVYFDYCEEVRNKTEAGCLCLGSWKPTFNSTLEARPNANGLGIRPDPSKITVISGGACSNPSQLQRDRDWCLVDYNTCNRRPAGVAGSTNELHWDYCAGAAPIGIAAPATPIATQQQQETGGGSPKADIIGPVVAAAGLAAVVFGVLMWRRYRRYQKLTSLQWVERHMPGMPFLQQQQRDIELGGPGRGGMQDYNGHDAIGKDSTSSTDPLRPRSPWDVGDMFAFKKRSNDQQQQYRHGNTSYRIQHGVDAPVRPEFAAAAAASEAAGAAPIREMKSVIVASKGASSLDGSSKMSQIPLMTQQSNYVSSSKEGQYMAAAAAAAGRGQQSLWMNQSAARSDGTSDSGLPNSVGLLGNLTEPTTKGSAAAAAAAAAEQRAAALAALWDSETFSCFVAAADKSPAAAAGAGGDSEPAQDTAAAAAAADTDGSVSRRQRQRQRHRYAASDGSHVARAISSPFASKDSSLLASLESYPPVVIDDNSTAGTSTTAAAAASYEGQEQQQQQQQGELASEESEEQPEGSVNIPLPIRTYTPNAPKTPSHEDSSRFAPSPSNAAAAAAAPAAAADASVRPQSTVQAGSSSSRVSWMLRSTTPVSEEYQTGDEDALDESMISGLTGMMTATGETIRHPEPSSTTATSAAAAATGSRSKTSSKAAPGLHRSIEAPGTCHMSGAMLDGNWDFEKVNDKPVRVLLQVTEEVDVTHPVTLLLLVSAPPPKPEVLSTIVLPKDPPQAGVDLGMDAKRDLAFPTNSFLGKGAFGQVHRALLRNRHPVAVKMLTDPDLRAADQETLKCFREELMILAKLDHTHILRCYGGNLDVVNPFIVTELCECSLDKMISHYQRKTGSGLPLKHTLTIGLHIASALWHLHPSIVHRDLKPQNILLDMNGTAKVADFGLSRIKTHTFVSTHHVEAGTAAYMAPECFGSAGVGEKVDVYALGMLLWECVTGVRPWKGCNMVQIAFQVAMQGNRPPLPAANPGRCPVELTQLMADCWAANPKERPSSGEVMKALAHLIRVYVPDH